MRRSNYGWNSSQAKLCVLVWLEPKQDLSWKSIPAIVKRKSDIKTRVNIEKQQAQLPGARMQSLCGTIGQHIQVKSSLVSFIAISKHI